MSESESTETIERIRHNMGNFLKNNTERARQIRHPADDCHWPKKEE